MAPLPGKRAYRDHGYIGCRSPGPSERGLRNDTTVDRLSSPSPYTRLLLCRSDCNSLNASPGCDRIFPDPSYRRALDRRRRPRLTPDLSFLRESVDRFRCGRRSLCTLFSGCHYSSCPQIPVNFRTLNEAAINSYGQGGCRLRPGCFF